MSGTYVAPTALQLAVDALRQDLLREDGPQISTVRNYNFAILPYAPREEFSLRRKIHALSEELRDAGWTVGTIPLHSLLLARLRGMEAGVVESIIRREKSLAGKAEAWRGLNHLKEKVASEIEGENGLAKDVIREIERILDKGEASPPSSAPSSTLLPTSRDPRPHRHLPRPGRGALPVRPHLRAAETRRGPHPERPRRPPLPRHHLRGRQRPLLHGRVARRSRLSPPHLPLRDC